MGTDAPAAAAAPGATMAAEPQNVGALLELLEEVEREHGLQTQDPQPSIGTCSLGDLAMAVMEERLDLARLGADQNEGTDCGKAGSPAGGRDVEALVALVRHEVRAAITQEFAALMHSHSPLHHKSLSEAGSDEKNLSERALASTAASSCAAASSFPNTDMQVQQSSSDAGKLGEDSAIVASVEWHGYAGAGLEAQVMEQSRAIASLQDNLFWHADRWDCTWKSEAELRAEGDQEVEKRICGRLEARLEAVESQLVQLTSSVGSIAHLQVELGTEAKIRQDADGKLQAFLRDFRAHVASEVEEMWSKNHQLSTSLEGVRSLMGQLVELVDLRCHYPLSARMARPEDLISVNAPPPGVGPSATSEARAVDNPGVRAESIVHAAPLHMETSGTRPADDAKMSVEADAP
mmetsp:Transcript_3640/g.9263  ORF Transcript_3640/g.9263 Transcript_3640/m.9263 type:complete len:406 (-) Transcript_3640:146-1363(-)